MSLHFERNDQNTVSNVARDFITFYYDNLNKKDYNQILNLIKPFSISSFEKAKYDGNNFNVLYNYYNQLNMSFQILDFDSLHSGARRINILVKGIVTYIENNQQTQKHFTEYIHLATGKPGEFWIQMLMFNTI